MKNFSGLTITGATSDGYSVKANGYVKGSWLQSSVMQNYGSNTGKVCVFDNSGWIYYRTPAEIMAEAGGGKGYTQLTNEDLNTITEAGWYRAESGNTCKHRPDAFTSTMSFVLEVEKSTDAYTKQTMYKTNANVDSYFTTYIRFSVDSGNTWSSWRRNQIMSDGYQQTFYGRKTFGDGINIYHSPLLFNDSNGSNGQVVMSQGSTTSPKWVNLQVKVNGTTYTADSDGLIDLGTISGGGSTTTYNSIGNNIY